MYRLEWICGHFISIICNPYVHHMYSIFPLDLDCKFMCGKYLMHS